MATVTTNTLWTRYLNSLGYSGSLNDMLVQALRFYSGSDRKSLNDLWNIYLTSEGARGSSASTKLYNYLGDKGHTAHSLDTRIRQSLIAGDVFVPAVDKSALAQAIADAEALNESDYTPESWALLEGALIAGHQVNDDPSATQSEVDQAEQEIRDAIAQLVPVPTVCVATLTHDIVDADPSYLPADISGNQFSLTFPTPGFDQYAASTSITDLKSLPASGTVWVEFRRSGVPAGTGFQFIDAVSTDAVNFISFDDGFEGVSLYEGGSFVGGAQLDSLGEVDSLMVGYNSAGELFVMDQYGVPRNVTEFPVDNSPLPSVPLSGFTAIAFVGAIIGSTELTGTASGQFVTDHEQFPYPPEGEAYDWCGNSIPTLPVYKGGLAQALADAGGLNPLNYTVATWSDVESAIIAGQLVLDDDDATQLEVNNAARAITTSINNLVEWTPAEEFSNGELGTYFDPSDISTLFQDSAGTTPVTGDGQPVGLMLDKSGNGNHAYQTTTAAKPTYSDVNGLGFDGVDDRLIVGTVDDFIWLHDGSPVTIGLVREVLPNNAQQQIVGTTHLGASALIGLSVMSETREVNARFGYDGFTIAHGETGFYTYRLSETSVDASDSQVATITYQYDSAIARTYVNGVLGSTAVPNNLSFSDSPSTYPLHIGGSGGGAQLLGNVKALVIYNKHLTPEAFERFQHWLAKKAGITL